MKQMIKIELIRLYKNIYYLGGCILAFVITCWFLNARPIPQLVKYSAEEVSILLSGAIILYFSFFIGLFIGNENEDGILRNKVIAGHSQKEVYFSHYISLLIAMIGMLVCWLFGALVGGARLNSVLMTYILIAIFYNAAYIAIIQALVFRLRKQATGIVFSIGIFYFLVNAVLFGNFIYMISEGNTIVAIIYNMSPLGQCFSRCGLAEDPKLSNPIMQVSISLVLMAAASLIGTLGLSKRDIN